MKLYVVFGQQLADFHGGLLVGEDVISLGNASQTDHGIASELGMVGCQKNLVGVGNNCLGHSDFAVIKIQERAVVMNAAYADDAEVHLELVDEIPGGFTDNPAIPVADFAARNDYVEIFLGRENGRDMEVVGNDLQVVFFQQGLGDGLPWLPDP